MSASYIIVSAKGEHWTGVGYIGGAEPDAFRKVARWQTLEGASRILSLLASDYCSSHRGSTIQKWVPKKKRKAGAP